eukprot:8253190-Pyramimonas_sp.AAC.1
MQYWVLTNWRPLKQIIRTSDDLRWRVQLPQQSSGRCWRASRTERGAKARPPMSSPRVEPWRSSSRRRTGT